MKQALKYLLKFIAKAIAIFFVALTFVIIFISFLKPEWIKEAIEWIRKLILTLGDWNYLIAFLSACIESLPLIGTAVPGMNIMILVGGFWGSTHFALTALAAVL
jgi:hypothetical protein